MNYSINFKIAGILSWYFTECLAEWSLQWNEEFDGTEFNQSRWNVFNEEYFCNNGYLKLT